ncbi:MAG: acyl-CoA dehydrogenase family protein [Planctomycetes bacterium]|nr:acyl-CoA dehydrogenase family protein [Planctomycetota bacterium]
MTIKFAGFDMYGLEALYTDEERMIRDTVRAFVDERVLPVIEKHNREATFPAQLVKPLGELGVFGATISGYECAGLNNVAYGLILQELERGDSGVRSFASVQSSLVMYPIHAFGSEAQKSKWLPRLAKGDAIGCFGLTEPDFGSNPGGMTTRAVKKAGRWVLNGTKRWITSGTIADVAVVWAKVEDGTVRGFLVEKGTRGYTAPEIKNKFSLRASVTSDLIFEDCEIPEENLLPKTEGLKNALMCLNQARYGIAWGAVGSMMACYDCALNYSKTRIQFDRPIGGFQLVQAKLAQMVTEIVKGQLLCLQLGRLKDQGKSNHVQVSIAKRNNVSWALEIARSARDILGASGIVDEYPIMRHMANLESVFTYEGTHDIHTLIIGEAVTGLPAYKG